jgi:hypothetical protein
MNRLWVVPFLCVIMIALSTFAAVDTDRHCSDCAAILHTAEQAANQGQWSTVLALAGDLRSAHTDYLRRAGWYASDERLNDATDRLWELTAAAETADRAAFALACCRTRAALQALAQEQDWSWGTLL